MKVGVFVAADRDGGGVYQYTLMVLQAIDQLRDAIEPVLVGDRVARQLPGRWGRSEWPLIRPMPPSPRSLARRAIVGTLGESAAVQTSALVKRARGRSGRSRNGAAQAATDAPQVNAPVGKWLRRHGIDLMVYPSPTTYSFECGMPYVMAVHDLQHRIQPEFPEVSANGEWESREFLFSNGIRNAEAILVDSVVGREDVLNYYGHLITPDRVRVLPFVPPPYLATPSEEELGATLRTLDLPATIPTSFRLSSGRTRTTVALPRPSRCSTGRDST